MLEDKELIDVLEAMMPVHHNMLSANLQATFDHQVYNRGKMFLTRCQMTRIYVGFLKRCKVQLTWCNIVGMRTLHHYWNT